MSENLNIMAKLAEAPYEYYGGHIHDEIGEFIFNEHFSDNRSVFYHSDDKYVLAIRGTVPKDTEDLYLDRHVFNDTLHKTTQFKNLEAKVEMLSHAFGPLILTGHSLGGSLCLRLLESVPELIVHVYAFNLGMGYKEFIKRNFTRLQCKKPRFLKSRKQKDKCEARNSANKKLTALSNTFDPISFLSRFSGVSKKSNTSNLNQHSLGNYIKGGRIRFDHFRISKDIM